MSRAIELLNFIETETKRLINEIEQLKKERDRLEAKCAEMREALIDILTRLRSKAASGRLVDHAADFATELLINVGCTVAASMDNYPPLSSDCGKGLIKVGEFLGLDKPWPLVDVLNGAAQVIDHLQHHHDCDCHGHERHVQILAELSEYARLVQQLIERAKK